ncbi:Mmp37 domain-containing protein [Cephalotus follicularis]|uniref:Phosphatidate cytidylyltransferase, mitochondrial n=1 Tax=Cephalotus follicularis TaxID=3775 RepID=A0A1Q3C4J8_CEPFO|nr:Mmp37 domain-containing protein [Cephalotus follicularis]
MFFSIFTLKKKNRERAFKCSIEMGMKNEIKAELVSFLKNLPPVEFCCVYGSALHPNNHDKSKMIDYVLGVSDPEQWHAENLKMNADHYAKRMGLMGGAKLITLVADKIGVGVHFNPFVEWNDKRFKYGVVRMHDLVQDILNWERFYLSGRLQKPVHILVDNLDIENVNCVNLRAAMSAALILLPPKFTEEDLYVKICSLSYMGDLRMLFAEDRNKVKKIVQGQFDLFQSRYKPFLEEYEAKELLRFSSSANPQTNISQECGLPVTRSLVSSLPPMVKSQIGMKLGVKNIQSESGRVINEVMTGSREEVARCMKKVLRRKVMVSSARQAASGLLTVGGVNAARYLASKMQKAWRSWT